MSEPKPLHRLFGLSWIDFFQGTAVGVETEMDLSLKQQFVDVVLIRKGSEPIPRRLPDGFEDLAGHNLVSFKSRHEALDGWALKELLGAHVAYRKLVSAAPTRLLPEDHFGLYAVAARFPHNLSGQVPWQAVQPGVYDCRWGTDTIRVVVAGELPREAHNAPLHLFSAAPELVGFGRGAYRRRSETTSQLLGQLFQTLHGEGFAMAYTMEDFKRDYFRKQFNKLTPEEQEELLGSLPPEQVLARLSPEQRLAGLPPEQRLAGLSAEQIRQYLDQLTAGRPAAARKPRRKK
jgi:hypothetical protein